MSVLRRGDSVPSGPRRAEGDVRDHGRRLARDGRRQGALEPARGRHGSARDRAVPAAPARRRAGRAAVGARSGCDQGARLRDAAPARAQAESPAPAGRRGRRPALDRPHLGGILRLARGDRRRRARPAHLDLSLGIPAAVDRAVLRDPSGSAAAGARRQPAGVAVGPRFHPRFGTILERPRGPHRLQG